MKKFTFKVVPPSNRRVWQIDVPVYMFWIVLVGVGLIVLSSVVDFADVLDKGRMKAHIAVLKNRNNYLRKNYVKLDTRLQGYDERIVELQELCDNVLILNSLPPIFKGQDNLSMGGIGLPEDNNLASIDENSLTTDFNIVFSQVELKLNLLKGGFHKVIDKMENSIQKWEHVPTIWPADGWVSSKFGWRSYIV